MSKLSPMLVPRAEIKDLTSLLESTLSRRARSVLRILPRMGRTDPEGGSRPCVWPVALGGPRVVLQELAEVLTQHLLHLGLHLGIHQLDLGLALELRIAMFDRDDGGEARTGVVSGEVGIGVLQQPGLAGVIVDGTGDSRPHPGQMGAAV